MSLVIPQALTSQEFAQFAQLIAARAGMVFSERVPGNLREGLTRRAQAMGCRSFAEYWTLLRGPAGDEELQRLVEQVTVHETAFFRNRAHFRALHERILPELIAARSSVRRLRFWSAGCSTGEEAYSLAITLLEVGAPLAGWNLSILATDLSEQALAQARAGVFRERAIRSMEPALLAQYFEDRDGAAIIRERPRQLVHFRRLNLIADHFELGDFAPVDVVFCQNVTIYFDAETTRRVIAAIHRALSDDGYLFLGYSETLWQITDAFEAIDIGNGFVYRKSRLLARPATPRRARQAGSTGLVRPRSGSLEGETVDRRARPRPAEAGPPDLDKLLREARVNADAGRLAAALAAAQAATECDPLSVDGHFLSGLLLQRLGQWREAISAFERVNYLDPDRVLAYYHLGDARRSSGDRLGAARAYRTALRALEPRAATELVGDFSADLLARICRQRLAEVE